MNWIVSQFSDKTVKIKYLINPAATVYFKDSNRIHSARVVLSAFNKNEAKGATKMAVFITGGHGHIGSWAAYFLAKEGQQIFLYDTNPMVPDHLAEVAQHITFIKGDVMDFPCLTDIFKKYKNEIDGILHTVGVMGELVL